MSQETIDILQSQIPMFNKLRSSARLTIAMRGTMNDRKYLQYIREVETSMYGMIQINEHTIATLQKQLNGGTNDTTSAEPETTTRATQLAEIAAAIGSGSKSRPQLSECGPAEIVRGTDRTPE